MKIFKTRCGLAGALMLLMVPLTWAAADQACENLFKPSQSFAARFYGQIPPLFHPQRYPTAPVKLFRVKSQDKAYYLLISEIQISSGKIAGKDLLNGGREVSIDTDTKVEVIEIPKAEWNPVLSSHYRDNWIFENTGHSMITDANGKRHYGKISAIDAKGVTMKTFDGETVYILLSNLDWEKSILAWNKAYDAWFVERASRQKYVKVNWRYAGNRGTRFAKILGWQISKSEIKLVLEGIELVDQFDMIDLNLIDHFNPSKFFATEREAKIAYLKEQGQDRLLLFPIRNPEDTIDTASQMGVIGRVAAIHDQRRLTLKLANNRLKSLDVDQILWGSIWSPSFPILSASPLNPIEMLQQMPWRSRVKVTIQSGGNLQTDLYGVLENPMGDTSGKVHLKDVAGKTHIFSVRSMGVTKPEDEPEIIAVKFYNPSHKAEFFYDVLRNLPIGALTSLTLKNTIAGPRYLAPGSFLIEYSGLARFEALDEVSMIARFQLRQGSTISTIDVPVSEIDRVGPVEASEDTPLGLTPRILTVTPGYK